MRPAETERRFAGLPSITGTWRSILNDNQNGNQGNSPPSPKDNRRAALGMLIAFVVWAVGMTFLYHPTPTTAPEPTVDLSQVATEVRAGQVQKITVEGDTL